MIEGESLPAGLPDHLQLWQGLAIDSLLVQDLDATGECVAYSERSGQTHFLNSLAVELIALLSQGPMPFGSLVEKVEEVLDSDAAPPQVLPWVRQTLEQLQSAGLVEPIPS